MITIKTTFSLTLSGMNDVLLLIHGLMKICLVISVLVLVVTWPGRSSAAGAVIHQGGLLFAGLVGATTGSMTLPVTDESGAAPPLQEPMSATQEDYCDSDSEVKPLFNIDGTPMFGDFDANGNPYGLTGSPFDRSDCDDTWSLFDY